MQPRQELLAAAGDIGGISANIIAELGDSDTDPELQELLLQLAKAVANATAALVLQAKNVASVTEDVQAQDKIIEAAKGRLQVFFAFVWPSVCTYHLHNK